MFDSKQFNPDVDESHASLLDPLLEQFTYRASIVILLCYATLIYTASNTIILGRRCLLLSATLQAHIGVIVCIGQGIGVSLSGYLAVKLQSAAILVVHGFLSFLSFIWGLVVCTMILLSARKNIQEIKKIYGTRSWDMSFTGIGSLLYLVNFFVGVSLLHTLARLFRARKAVAKRDARLKAEAEAARQSLIITPLD